MKKLALFLGVVALLAGCDKEQSAKKRWTPEQRQQVTDVCVRSNQGALDQTTLDSICTCWPLELEKKYDFQAVKTAPSQDIAAALQTCAQRAGVAL